MTEVYDGMKWLRDYINVANPFTDAFRWLGYGLCKMLAWVVDKAYEAIEGLLGINIMKIGPVQQFASKMNPLIWSILAISLVIAGITIILYPQKNKGEMARALLLATILIAGMPFMFNTLNSFKNAGVSDISALTKGGSSPGEQILKASLVDVGRSIDGLTLVPDNENPYYSDINARLPKSKTFGYKITSVIDDVAYGEKLEKGFFGWGEERLYAKGFKFLETIVILLVTLVALVFAGFKIGRILYDLAFHQLIAPIVYASDLQGSGRTKKFLQSLIGLYITLVIVLALIKLYLDMTTWAALNVSNIWVRILLIAGASWGVIDGPDIVQKLLGIDAGVRSGTSVIMGGMAAVGAAKSVAGLAKSGANMAKQVPQAAANVAKGGASVAGGVAGIAGAASSLAGGWQAKASGDVGSMKEMQSFAKDDTGAKTGFSKGKSAVTNTAMTVGYAARSAVDKVKSSNAPMSHSHGTVGSLANTSSVDKSSTNASANVPSSKPSSTSSASQNKSSSSGESSKPQQNLTSIPTTQMNYEKPPWEGE
mgnify:CR=1 FL=1